MAAVTRLGPGGYPVAALPATGAVNATVSATLGALTASAAAAVIVSAAVNQTLGALTATATLTIAFGNDGAMPLMPPGIVGGLTAH